MNVPVVPKTIVDCLLERMRFAKAKSHITRDSDLLDVGAGDGTFLHYLDGHVASAVGIDPILNVPIVSDRHQLLPGDFPDDFVYDSTFDVITLLAVIEHIPQDALPSVASTCWKYLNPGGRVIITVPHPIVDKILDVLKFFRLIEGLSLDEHYGFSPATLPQIFNRFTLLKKERWQLGCNYLFVFVKP